MKKSLILVPFAALVLAGCSYSPAKPTTDTQAPTTGQSVDPTTQSVDPTTQSVDPTSDTSVDPTTQSVDPTTQSVDPTTQSVDPTTTTGTTQTTTVPPGTHDGLTPETAFTGLEAAAKCQEIGSTYSTEKYYVVDTVFSKDSGFSPSYGSHSFHLGSDAGLYCFRLKNGANHDKFTADSDIEVGDTVMVYGQLVLYKGETPEMSYSYESKIEGYVYSITKGGSEVKVTGVSVDPTSASLHVGETQQLTPTVLPEDATNKNVSYETNAASVATVSSSGLISAVGVGDAAITVKTEDGNKTATCNVTVSAIAVTGVSLNETTKEVNVGTEFDLVATIAPENATNKNVSWSSSDSAVAVVSNGHVTALDAGNATITVTTEDGNKTAQCVVTVTGSKVPVTGVTLNKGETTILVGGSETLEATVLPEDATNKSVTWSSNDTSIATVSNGVVTGVAVGAAIITVTTVDGELTETCVVHVDPVPVTGVTLNKSSATINVNGTVTLVATVAPKNATNKNVSWSSDDESVATVSNGVVTGVAAGNATITVTTEDGSKTANCEITVNAAPEHDGSTPEKAFTGEEAAAKCAEIGKDWSTEKYYVKDVVYSIDADFDAKYGNFTFHMGSASGLTGFRLSNGPDHEKFTSASDLEVGDTVLVYGQMCMYGGNTPEMTYSYNNKIEGYIVSITKHGSDPVPLQGISLPATAEVGIDSTTTLTPTFTPFNATNKNVTWSSSDAATASVVDGVVTGHKEGSATITVISEDGGFEAQCVVTVSSKPTPSTVPIELSTDGGTQASECTVNGNDGIKAGSKNTAGEVIVKVPAKSTVLIIHIAGWKGASIKLDITGAGLNKTSYEIASDNGITGESPYSLSGSEGDFAHEFALTGVTSETSISFKASSGTRFVVWDASVQIA